jgi:hypothetical protein
VRDLERVRLPDDRAALAAWLENARPAVDRHFDRHKAWKERDCVNELLKRQDPARPFLPLDAELWKQEEPDFLCRCADDLFLLEVSEATDPRDRREIALMREREVVRFIGDKDGRFSEGALGDEYEEAMAFDIQRAATMKAEKNYAPDRCQLLLYCNSNAMFADPEKVFERLSPYQNALPFEAIAILLRGNHLMIWTADDVRLSGPRT